jgi:hypothetical protein
MVMEAWKVAFPSLRFPLELIGLFPAVKSPLVAAPHQSDPQAPPSTHQQSREPTVERAIFLPGAKGGDSHSPKIKPNPLQEPVAS